MSSGCCHPKIFSYATAPRFLPQPSGCLGFITHLGDKKSEEPIYLSNSASQTLVMLRSQFCLYCAGCQQFIKTFLPGSLVATRVTLSNSKQASTAFLLFCNFFCSGCRLHSRKERAAEHTRNQIHCKSFLQKFFTFVTLLPRLLPGAFQRTRAPTIDEPENDASVF